VDAHEQGRKKEDRYREKKNILAEFDHEDRSIKLFKNYSSQ